MDEVNVLVKVMKKFIAQEKEIENLKSELLKRDAFIQSTPQLSHTALGRSTSDGKIIYRNWWISYKGEFEGILDENWFTQFVQHRFPNEDYKLNFFSIWNNHYNIKEDMPGKKIFYTAENLNKIHSGFNKKYGSYALDFIDLALGYDYIDNSKYLRLPYWILTVFNPKFNEEDIERTFENLKSVTSQKTDNVTVINRHDNWGIRTLIANDVEQYTDIAYAGLWRKNTDDLVAKYNNNKINYLRNFKFNICAENVIDDGYVTEKIFDAINGDCIPLYAGGGKSIEPNVLNDDAVLRWHFDKDNSDTVELFKNLLNDDKSYNEFKDQDIILDSAAKVVIKIFDNLEHHFERLIFE